MEVGTGNWKVLDELIESKNPRTRVKFHSIKFGEITIQGVMRATAVLPAVFDYEVANGDEPLREAGLFTASTCGLIYNRMTFAPVTKTVAFKLNLKWEIVFQGRLLQLVKERM